MVVMFKRLVCILLLASFGSTAACDWPAWQRFKQDYISEGGELSTPVTRGK